MGEVLAELRRLAVLAVPLALTQLGNMMLGIVDMLMLGRVGREALDAAALGNLWGYAVLTIGMGMVLGCDPFIAQAHGAGDGRTLGLTLQRGVVLAVIASVPVMLLWLLAGPGLQLLGQAPHLAVQAHEYLLAQLPGAPAVLLYVAMRSYLQGRGITGPALVVMLAANIVNVGLNYWLIFGGLGVPALGAVGAGIATGVVRVLMAAALAWLIVRRGMHHGAWVPWSRAALDRTALLAIAGVGVGIGLQLGLEIWAFQAAMLFAGWLGDAPLAAYTIVLNLASVSFMIPVGIAMAAVTRVGNLLGSDRLREAERAAWVALGLGAAVMCASAVLMYGLRSELPALFKADAEVYALAAASLPIAAAFQLFDGVQVVGFGVLRAMGRTRYAAVINFFGYYAVALPLAWWLAFERGHGIAGLWWGLTVGLALVAVALLAWIAARGPATARKIALEQR
ncbi:MATE family efflux transporter [Nannocystis bainbridge]|uniref:Multidrug-efflux transporter n=1 Tax=Nannocystis bainbridge TaxID=2995303 RepID=A0ABT5DR11_9BACT|nr:MATE family efflux transporter [Nannocystis bainbridge]MDC0716092.1 MATE family efflux transporter [Nannocystis bainbridge]